MNVLAAQTSHQKQASPKDANEENGAGGHEGWYCHFEVHEAMPSWLPISIVQLKNLEEGQVSLVENPPVDGTYLLVAALLHP